MLSLKLIALVGIGGAMGAIARYLVGVATIAVMGHGFPYATIIVNIVGSFLMGALIAGGALRFELSAELRGLFAIGLLGAFTTFSTFSLDAISLYERGRIMAAGLYVVVSLIGSIVALVAGLSLIRRFYS